MAKRRSKKKRNAGSLPDGMLLDLRDIEAIVAQLGASQEPDSDELAAAQEMVWDAWEKPDRRSRVALAKKALEVSSLCADAYVLLAQETARNADEALRLYRQGVEAGENALGPEAFRNDVGHFWGLLETRPYMRARQGLAQALWETGARDDAVVHYEDMLRLNPNDNQGIRYLLIDCLLTLGRDDDAGKLLRRYKRDGSAAWTWSAALLIFRREGDTSSSRKTLTRAVVSNGHVSAYLLGRKRLPRNLPDFIGMGDVNEAVAYVHGATQAWAAAPGALAWVEGRLEGRAQATLKELLLSDSGRGELDIPKRNGKRQCVQ